MAPCTPHPHPTTTTTQLHSLHTLLLGNEQSENPPSLMERYLHCKLKGSAFSMYYTDHFWDVCKQLKSNYRGRFTWNAREQKEPGPLWSFAVVPPVNPFLFRHSWHGGLIHYRDTSRWETRSQKHLSCVLAVFFFFETFYHLSFSLLPFFSSISYLWHANQLTMPINILAATCCGFRGVFNACSTQDWVWL